MIFKYYVVLVLCCLPFCVEPCELVPKSPLEWEYKCNQSTIQQIPESYESLPSNLRVVNFSAPFNLIENLIFTKNWKDLKIIDVSRNHISIITNKTFVNLPELKMLNVSYNLLDFIAEDAFVDNSQLEVLDLCGNKGLAHNASFYSLLYNVIGKSRVKFLYLSDLGIKSIPQNTLFSKNSFVKKINLSHNNLTSLSNLPTSLWSFDISHNSFEELEKSWTYFLHQLAWLFIEYNTNLISIEHGFFDSMDRLTYLSFKGCSKLSYLPSNSFTNNLHLKYLSLAECNFHTLSVKMKVPFARLHALDLRDNPWSCNSSIKWFIHLQIPDEFSNHTRCAFPLNLTVTEWLGPREYHQLIRLTFLGFIVLVFSSITLVIWLGCRMEKKRRDLLCQYRRLQDWGSIKSFEPDDGPVVTATTSV